MKNTFFLAVADEKRMPSTGEGSSFLQSRQWAQLKSNFGWKPLYLSLDGKGVIILIREFFPGFSLAYVPHAIDEKYKNSLEDLSLAVKKYLPKGSVFIRYDLTWNKTDSPGSPLVKAASDIQPPSTVIIDLTRSKEELLAGMKSKTRYNIKLSGKKGIIVRRCGLDSLDEWYDIYSETAERDKISLHSLSYYRKIFEIAEDSSEELSIDSSIDIRLYMAESEGRFIAGIITCFYKKKAVYLYGASRNTGREKMPSYALQWQAICDAKDEGCVSYDMFGIPPADDPTHPMHGLYRFKTGFGGVILHMAGCYDFPLNPLKYFIYRVAEQVRFFYYKKLRKSKIS
ncbi:MAG: peptidoglycan bridge formation glycyltransferase FemA/FemB family protein [Spirochaetia bacterium]|jgi:lipid II:glycine glycyltransferase (peptidoglycan interpeptide bridge formation enzyme)|nr:peptidoglycan bridge formation glycyltransferase FemA/FemB family protein [Spirochaetia bacterium]